MKPIEYTGILYVETDGTWHVAYDFDKPKSKTIPLYPGDAKKLDYNKRTAQVDFNIISEFTNPVLYRGTTVFEGVNYAKLIDENESEEFNLGISDFFKMLYNKIFKK